MTKPANSPQRQPARRSRTITVTAHHMPEDWHIGIWTGNIGAACGLWFGNHEMIFAGLIILLGYLAWYAVSRALWRRTIIRRAAGRQILIRKPRRWWRTWQ